MAAIALPHPPAATSDPEPVARASTVALIARARSLRANAAAVHPLVAQAYRRRAAELGLQAWAQANHLSPTEIDDLLPAA